MSTSSESGGVGSAKPIKKTPNDFVFGKVIGEGSYSTVSCLCIQAINQFDVWSSI